LPIPEHLKSVTLNCWHKDFPLEDIPDIPLATLPESPNSPFKQKSQQKFSTIEELDNLIMGEDHPELMKKRDLVRDLGHFQNDIKDLSIRPDVILGKQVPEELRNVAPDIIYKARLQEQQQINEESLGTVAARQQQYLLNRLPLLCDMIWSYFCSLGKSIMPFDAVITHLSSTYRTPISKQDVEVQMEMLLKLASQWCMIKSIDNKSWIKIVKDSKVFVEMRKSLVTNNH